MTEKVAAPTAGRALTLRTSPSAPSSTVSRAAITPYPYDREKYDQKTLMRMCRGKEFPQLTDSTEDGNISMCWNGRFGSVAELEQVFRNTAGGTEWYLFDAEANEWVAERLEECVAWASAGGVEGLRG